MAQCTAFHLVGDRYCLLEAGHEGPHRDSRNREFEYVAPSRSDVERYQAMLELSERLAARAIAAGMPTTDAEQAARNAVQGLQEVIYSAVEARENLGRGYTLDEAHVNAMVDALLDGVTRG